MNSVDSANAPIPPRRGSAPPPPEAPAPAQRIDDAIQVSLDARVRLGRDNRPEVVLEHVGVSNGDALAVPEVEKHMANRRPGLREQVTREVVRQIAEQVAVAIAPTLEAKLEEALIAEHLPPALADDLARESVPAIAKIVAEQIAKQVKVKTSISLGF